MRTIILFFVFSVFAFNESFPQTRINKRGIAYYTSNCTGSYLVRQDTFKISTPKTFKLPSDTNSQPTVSISTRCFINSKANPLLVVDGVVCEFNKLTELNANDILSVTILKSGSNLSFCRPIKANGAIIITTTTSQNVSFAVKDFITKQPIPNATILFIPEKYSDKKQVLLSNDSGIVKTERQNIPSNYELTVSAIGYKNFVAALKKGFIQKEIFLQRDYKSCPEVIVSSQIYRRTIHCGMRCMSLIVYNDSIENKLLFSNFKIYPNPVAPNSTLNIEWKQKEFGDFMLQLYNQSGQLIFSKKVNVSEGQRLFTLNMPSVIAGNYFLKLVSKTNGRSYTEKLVVNE